MKAIVIVPFFIATVRQNKDFQISHTLRLAWVLSSCMFLLHLILYIVQINWQYQKIKLAWV
jgi:hypothetical protein